MISKITLQNFKSLENVELGCSNLNVLTGLNGLGKSSVIQALLLLRQSYERGLLQKDGLALNGELVELGVAKEALYVFAEKEEISFQLTLNENRDLSWAFVYNSDENSLSHDSSDILQFADDIRIPNELEGIALFSINKFKYLNAERLVKNEYATSMYQVQRKESLGKFGEFAAHYLEHFGPEPINSAFLHKGSKVNSLNNQVSAWMSEISPGIKVKAEKLPGVNSVKLRYEFEENGDTTGDLTPSNVGFGITYTLPVLIALLSAKEGDLLIIENPESHIHPKGQSTIGDLLVKAASQGAQIFIETHSDHIINGIRVAIKKGADANLSRLTFFTRGSKNHKIYSEIQSPTIDSDGRIDFWPENFFDEWDNNLLELL